MTDSAWWDSQLAAGALAAIVSIGAVILDRHLEQRRQRLEAGDRMLMSLATAAAEMGYYDSLLDQIATEMRAAAGQVHKAVGVVLPGYRPREVVFTECRSLLIGLVEDHGIIRDLTQCEFDVIHVTNRLDAVQEQVRKGAPGNVVAANMNALAELAIEIRDRMRGAKSRTMAVICSHPQHDRMKGLERLVPGGCGCRRTREYIEP